MQQTKVKIKRPKTNEKFEEDMIIALQKSEEDYKNGRVRNARDVFKEWGIPYDV